MQIFRCSECSKEFKTETGLIWHTWHIHDITVAGKRPPKELPTCDVCYMKGWSDGHNQPLRWEES